MPGYKFNLQKWTTLEKPKPVRKENAKIYSIYIFQKYIPAIKIKKTLKIPKNQQSACYCDKSLKHQ